MLTVGMMLSVKDDDVNFSYNFCEIMFVMNFYIYFLLSIVLCHNISYIFEVHYFVS